MKKKILIETNDKKIKQMYPTLNAASEFAAWVLYQNIFEGNQLIREFLYTQDAKKTVSILKRMIGNNATIQHNTNRILITYKIVTPEFEQAVNEFMINLGWSPSHIGNKLPGNGKYSTNLKNFLHKKNIPVLYSAKNQLSINVTNRYLYHITPDIIYPKIKAKGLITKTQSKIGDHPERIYMFDGLPSDIESLCELLVEKYENIELVNELFLLRVDTQKIKDHVFFEDIDFPLAKAIWTYQMIPPGYIELIKKYPNTLKPPKF